MRDVRPQIKRTKRKATLTSLPPTGGNTAACQLKGCLAHAILRLLLPPFAWQLSMRVSSLSTALQPLVCVRASLATPVFIVVHVHVVLRRAHSWQWRLRVPNVSCVCACVCVFMYIWLCVYACEVVCGCVYVRTHMSTLELVVAHVKCLAHTTDCLSSLCIYLPIPDNSSQSCVCLCAAIPCARSQFIQRKLE